jgi:hypothetical protein
MESYFDLRDRLTKKYGLSLPKEQAAVAVETPEQLDVETAFVLTPPGTDKMYVTGRVKAEHWETPVNRAFTYVTGRYVQADRANKNNAYWSSEDLEFGAPSVAFGPVNLLHEEKAIIGTISEAHLNQGDEQFGTHITTCNVLWKYLYPGPVQAIEAASSTGELWQSMECVAEQVQCLDGCGEAFDYQEWMRNKASGCEHLLRGGMRRMVRPTFLATGLIFGASRPAWADADVEVRKESAKMAEEKHLFEGNMTRAEAENLVMQVLHWANRK